MFAFSVVWGCLILEFEPVDLYTAGSYGSTIIQHVMGSSAMHEDEQFAAACQSAVDELTAWPAAGHNPSQNRMHVLAHGLVAVFGLQECLQALKLPPHPQLCTSSTVDGLSVSADACDTYDSQCAHGLHFSSLESSMLGEELLHEHSAHVSQENYSQRLRPPGTYLVVTAECSY